MPEVVIRTKPGLVDRLIVWWESTTVAKLRRLRRMEREACAKEHDLLDLEEELDVLLYGPASVEPGRIQLRLIRQMALRADRNRLLDAIEQLRAELGLEGS